MQNLVNLITGTVGKLIAVLAICVVGIGALMGALSMRAAAGVVLGVILIISSAWRRSDRGPVMTQDALTEDPLVPRLHPARHVAGRVPLEAVALNGMATDVIFVLMSNPFYLLIEVLIHYATRALIGRNYNLFVTVRLWLATKGRARNQDLWGGASIGPLPLRPAREVRVHV